MGNLCRMSVSYANRRQQHEGYVTYISDVEGHWPYFCDYVSLSAGIHFVTRGDHVEARSSEDLELRLEDGWQFVFGGDSSDKGPGTLRFLEAMCLLKRKYPKRVHLILGNRDINKMRWTSDLADSEVARMKERPGAYWVDEKQRKTPLQFLRDKAARHHKVDESRVTDRMLAPFQTKANLLLFMLAQEMGSEGELDFRREELRHMQGAASPEGGQVSDDDVLASYEGTVRPGGLVYEYLDNAVMGVRIGDALFVHGNIIGTGYKQEQVRRAGADGVAWNIGEVPDSDEWIEDVDVWLAGLNAWARKEIDDWKARPTWETPPAEPTYESWRGRGGSELMAYGTPGTRYPTVVYSRWLDKKCMPMPYPDDLVRHLEKHHIKFVIVGHTPHGNCPTVIHSGSVTTIMSDTSYSHPRANIHFKGDNRGYAATEICLTTNRCHIHGWTQDEKVLSYTLDKSAGSDGRGDSNVGLVQASTPDNAKLFFIKAKLPAINFGTQYLMSHVDGFLYEYAIVEENELQAVLNGLPLANETVSFPVGHMLIQTPDGSKTDFVERLFSRVVDMAAQNAAFGIQREVLLSACSERAIRKALEVNFPGIDLSRMMEFLSESPESAISQEQFLKLCTSSTRLEGLAGVYCELVRSDDGNIMETAGEWQSWPSAMKGVLGSADRKRFGKGFGNFELQPTVGLKPSDLLLPDVQCHDVDVVESNRSRARSGTSRASRATALRTRLWGENSAPSVGGKAAGSPRPETAVTAEPTPSQRIGASAGSSSKRRSGRKDDEQFWTNVPSQGSRGRPRGHIKLNSNISCGLGKEAFMGTENLKRLWESFHKADVSCERLRSAMTPLTRLQDSALQDELREGLSIGASHFAWCYPFISDWSGGATDVLQDMEDPDIGFLRFGGFVYARVYDSLIEVTNLCVLTPAPHGPLKFTFPRAWTQPWTKHFDQANRVRPVVHRTLQESGACDYFYVRHEELRDIGSMVTGDESDSLPTSPLGKMLALPMLTTSKRSEKPDAHTGDAMVLIGNNFERLIAAPSISGVSRPSNSKQRWVHAIRSLGGGSSQGSVPRRVLARGTSADSSNPPASSGTSSATSTSTGPPASSKDRKLLAI